jgi:DNA-binding NtrC family response regulator
MSRKILIVEDESLVAYDLELTLTQAHYLVCGVADTVPEALQIIEEQQPEVVIVDIFLKGKQTGIDLAKILTERGIAFIYVSANYHESVLEKAKATQPYGFLIKPFRPNELLVMMEVVLYRHQNSREAKMRQEEVLEASLKSILAEKSDWKLRLLKIARSLQPYLPFDYLTIHRSSEDQHPLTGISLLRTGFDKYEFVDDMTLLETRGLSEGQLRRLRATSAVMVKANFYSGIDLVELCQKCAVREMITKAFHLQSYFHSSLLSPEDTIFHMSFFSRRTDVYTADHQKLLNRISQELTRSIEAVVPRKAFNAPPQEKNLSRNAQPIPNRPAVFDEIIGNDHQILTVLDHVMIAAPIDTSVLILGETGTGKEQIARSIHYLSPRKDNPLVIINCASLPANLIESELFGHERGAFTGATEKRKGKFELADKGTIFLDEIGEMPLELQVKLLRVLQEHEIERVGGSGVIKVNVRVIAATNLDLEHEVREGRFRLDLYYRLCVFPIQLPALRERKGDIPLLTAHFIQRYAQKFQKAVTGISPEALAGLMSYHWPGNIRQLENFVERGVLLSHGSLITADIRRSSTIKTDSNAPAGPKVGVESIDENMRQHILDVLKKCNGKISGAGGAAQHLGLPATTLHSKIKKLGLKKWSQG